MCKKAGLPLVFLNKRARFFPANCNISSDLFSSAAVASRGQAAGGWADDVQAFEQHVARSAASTSRIPDGLSQWIRL